MRGALVLVLVLRRSAALEEDEDEDEVRATVLCQEGGRMKRDGERLYSYREGGIGSWGYEDVESIARCGNDFLCLGWVCGVWCV